MIQVGEIRLEGLDNGSHFSYHTTAIGWAKANETIASKCVKFITPYDASLVEEDIIIKTSPKSPFTDAIVSSDRLRDDLYRRYRNAVKAMDGIAIEEMASAAKTLMQHIKDYRINTSAQIDKETGYMLSFVKDLQEKYADEVATLNLTTIVEQLAAANNQVADLLRQRDIANKDREIGATKRVRADVDKAYRQLIQVINAYVLIEGEEAYADFIGQMNSLIKRYKQQVLGQTAGTDKEDEEETPEPVKPEITKVYSKVEDPHDPTGITRGKETIMKWVGGFELVNETGDGPGKIIVKDNFTGVEEEVPVEDILSRSNTGCEFIMIRDFAEGDYKIRIETYDGGSPLVLEYPEVIKLV